MIESLSEKQKETILRAIYLRQKVQAIKLVREAVGCELIEAKDFVEKFSAELEAKSPHLFVPKRKGCSAAVVMVAVIGLFTFLVIRLIGRN